MPNPVDLSIDADEESVYTLGKTGDTVVYIFPDGDALLERTRQPSPQSAQLSTHTPAPIHSGSALSATLEQLIREAGLITVAQYAVAAYDQETTGMSLLEVLEMRGWITAADLLRLQKAAS